MKLKRTINVLLISGCLLSGMACNVPASSNSHTSSAIDNTEIMTTATEHELVGNTRYYFLLREDASTGDASGWSVTYVQVGPFSSKSKAALIRQELLSKDNAAEASSIWSEDK